ncbi:DUF2809 domain-containing protein [Aquimarina sp. AD10]|nr:MULTISPECIES: DUF2809 domain-containing protein [Aquimarina]AXT59833.1 DUF2809 domain-containing protein [Aquimarina sp. AD10]RKN00251.1 DUF2809 domain-containing protein [Aquimarina sp. AD10]
MMLRFHKKYFILTILVFLIEIIIAMYIDDAIIRPYFGDTLVVFLLYYGVKTFFNLPVLKTALFVLLFCYFVEIMQYFKVIYFLGLQESKLARIVIGSSFSWMDILAYTLGFLLIVWLENTSSFRKFLDVKND